jgi:hypothetical protein
MLQAYEELGEATAREAFTYLYGECITSKDELLCDTLRRRAEELYKKGLLLYLGKRKCKHTGIKVDYYGIARKKEILLPGFEESMSGSFL